MGRRSGGMCCLAFVEKQAGLEELLKVGRQNKGRAAKSLSWLASCGSAAAWGTSCTVALLLMTSRMSFWTTRLM